MDAYLDIFTNPKRIFCKTFKSVDQLSQNCIYVLDTNVLLLPYTVGNKELTEIERVYASLLAEEKLLLPSQVAKEFAKNRPKKLEEMFKALSDYLSRVKTFEMPKYPMLAQLPEYEQILQIEEQVAPLSKQYKKQISKILEHIRLLNWDDKVSMMYSRLFGEEVVVDHNWQHDEIKKELDARHKFNLPPAYKDKSKDDGGIGDLIIWKDLLRLGTEKKCDILFVTGDEKADWFHQSMSAKIYPRYELLHEFKEATGGQDVYFISLSDLIELFSDKIDIVENIRIVEEQTRFRPNPSIRLQAILNVKSKCQMCHMDASIEGKNGSDFLEIHHIRKLSSGGEDSLSNIAVLCPNCHKTVHARMNEEREFLGGSPCQMSGQVCPGCHIGLMDVADGWQDGVECHICGLHIPAPPIMK